MPAQDTAESKQFCSGDLVIRSSDGVLFCPHKENLEFVSDVAFPFTSTTLHKADKAIDMQEDSKTLETLLHFAYPKLQLPDFAALSFTELIQVERAADKYQMYHGMEICQLYLARNHAFTHPYEVLELAAKRDSNVLVAAVAPFLIHLSIEEVASLGVSSRLCLKWGIYRERWLNALLEAQQYLDEHYHNHWHRLRRHMKDRLPLHAVLVLGKSRPGLTVQGVQSIYEDCLSWLSSNTNGDISCCRSQLEKWRDNIAQKLENVQWPS